ncbi:MAG: IS3 family transposase [Nitrososphaeraceae archaeon]|nr:IS3 family transposase [Nitrososphaeraceae archaeon]
MVRTIVNNKTNTTNVSVRKVLKYSGSKNMYYGNKDHGCAIATAVTAVTAETSSTKMIEQEIQKIFLHRPTYGTRRMAAMLTRVLGISINRKRVQRIFRKMGYITPAKSKKEILRTKIPNVKANRPNQVWEADLTYIHCGIDEGG